MFRNQKRRTACLFFNDMFMLARFFFFSHLQLFQTLLIKPMTFRWPNRFHRKDCRKYSSLQMSGVHSRKPRIEKHGNEYRSRSDKSSFKKQKKWLNLKYLFSRHLFIYSINATATAAITRTFGMSGDSGFMYWWWPNASKTKAGFLIRLPI